MRKLDRSPSHSWWWNSHKSPKHSNWLESSLQELDEKIKEMLSLIEEDADSFAQRAELYYQKRPELVNLVEEFYRAYRSLAERYDRLTGEIRQNIPRALQDQYGLSFRDSSPNRSMVGPFLGIYHQHSPLRKSQAFESLLRKAEEASSDRRDETKRVDSMEWLESASREHDRRDETKRVDSMEWLESASRVRDRTDHVSEGRANGCSNHCIKSENKGKFMSEEGELTSSGSSDSEVDNITLPLEKLQEEIASLEKENKLIADSHKKVLELNETLQIKVEILEDQCRNIEKDAGALKDYNRRLLQAARTFGIQEVGKLVGGNPNSCVDVQGPCHQDQLAKDADVANGCGHDDEMQDDANAMDGIQSQYFMDSCGKGQLAEDISGDQFISLLEENWKQKQVILERGEEKREAIRQLCISMDMLKHENARLELKVSVLKKRLHASRLGTFVGPTASPLRFLPPLKKVLCFLGD